MIQQVLITVAKIVGIIIGMLVEGIHLLVVFIYDALAQAKDATPDTVSTLKETLGVASVSGVGVAQRYVGDLRKVFKIQAQAHKDTDEFDDLSAKVAERVAASAHN